MKIHTPAMTFKSEAAAAEWTEGLKKNQDSYGNGVYQFASDWATKMEQAIAAGATIAACAKETASAADEGITGFMYGCAVGILAAWWINGEELRRWHNLDVQFGTEGEKANEGGGVLNPALLSIGPKS